MSYSFLIGATIFAVCSLLGRLRIGFALDELDKPSRKALFAEVDKSEIRFSFIYVFIFIVVFCIFEIFPTIDFRYKFAPAMAFLIFTVSTGYGAVVKVHRLRLPRKVFYSVLSGFLLIVSGYVVFVVLIRDSLAIRIWY